MAHETLDHKFQLRSGLVVGIRNLPVDMTAQEAERLAAFIRTLATPEKES